MSWKPYHFKHVSWMGALSGEVIYYFNFCLPFWWWLTLQGKYKRYFSFHMQIPNGPTRMKKRNNKNKRAIRPWLAHLSKQAKGQTPHSKKKKKLNNLKLSKHERLVKGQRTIWTSNAKKNVLVLTYLTVSINFCTKIFDNFINTPHMHRKTD